MEGPINLPIQPKVWEEDETEHSVDTWGGEHAERLRSHETVTNASRYSLMRHESNGSGGHATYDEFYAQVNEHQRDSLTRASDDTAQQNGCLDDALAVNAVKYTEPTPLVHAMVHGIVHATARGPPIIGRAPV